MLRVAGRIAPRECYNVQVEDQPRRRKTALGIRRLGGSVESHLGNTFPRRCRGTTTGRRVIQVGLASGNRSEPRFLKGQTPCREIGDADAAVGDCSIGLGEQSPKPYSPSSAVTDGWCQWSVEKPIWQTRPYPAQPKAPSSEGRAAFDRSPRSRRDYFLFGSSSGVRHQITPPAGGKGNSPVSVNSSLGLNSSMWPSTKTMKPTPP